MTAHENQTRCPSILLAGEFSAVSLAVSSIFLIQLANGKARESQASRLESIALMAAQRLDPTLIQEVLVTGSEDNNVFRSQHKILEDVAKASLLPTNLYTMKSTDSGWIFSVDAFPPGEDH